MTIFSKVDKKVLLVLIAILLAFMLVSFLIYKYMASSTNDVQNLTGGAQIEYQVQVQAGGIEVEADKGGGTFSICMDKCGDGVCQKTDLSCPAGGDINCVCLETSQECPQDCK